MKLALKTEQIDADLSKVVDKIVKQYEIYPNAFQKEAIQNAWDVRLDTKNASGWEIKFYTYEENGQTHLIVEDFGTKGMNKKRWDAFLSLWKPEKEKLDAGGQGQGKFVLMKASNEHILIVESKSDEIPYQCRYLKDERKSSESQNYNIKYFIPNALPLNHKGTKIWIYNVEGKFLKILQSEEFIDSIIESWWQILGPRFGVRISLFGKDVRLPKIPSPKEEVSLFPNKPFNNFGRIKRLVLTFYEEPVSNVFQNIRIQRANMMITKIPFEIHNKEYQNCFSGYMDFDNDLERQLKGIERTDHCGFIYDSPWKEIKTLVKQEAEKFVNKIVPPKEEKRAIDIKNLSRIINKANQIISDYCPEVVGGGTFVPPIPPKPDLLLRIKYLSINKREPKFGDILKPSCTILNNLSEDKKIALSVKIKRSGAKVFEEEYRFRITAGQQKIIKLSEIKLDTNNFQKGKHILRVTIRENRSDTDTKSTSFYLETRREPIKRGFIKKVEFYHNPDEPIRYRFGEKGIIKLNTGHRDFENIWKIFQKNPTILNRQMGFYIIKICLDEAINELLKMKLKDNQEVEFDDLVQEIRDTRDKMYQEVYV